MTIALFAAAGPDSSVVLATELPHPADARFTAYQLKDGRWLGIDPSGAMTFTTAIGSYQAFRKADSAGYLLADRTAFHGGCYRVPFFAFTEPSGPIA